METARGVELPEALPTTRRSGLRSSGLERRRLTGGLVDSRAVLEAAATPAEPREHFALRALLVALDVSAFTIAWLLALPVWARGMGPKEAIVLLVGIVTCSIGLVAAQGLYLARVSSVRSVEIARLGRVVLLVGLGAFVVTGRIGTEMDLAGIALGSVFAFLCVNGGRGAYNGWLRRSRTRGRFCRIVVIVGTG
ncbi:MAG: hypothetical protein FJW88_13870, partial [Actinobacteria bacterium]|nr:hypothetical protein [Actinomycetota bacterium]